MPASARLARSADGAPRLATNFGDRTLAAALGVSRPARVRAAVLTSHQRARLAVAILLVVAAGNAYLGPKALLRIGMSKHGGRPDPYIAELAGLRGLLPPDARIGYANPGISDAAVRKRDQFLTRYALAPRCVGPAPLPPWLLVGGDASPGSAASAEVALVRDLDNGFRLYRHLPPP
jgi:hypothetical protein